MSEPSKKALVPVLRFPEFRDAGEWEEKRLEDVAPFQRGFDLPSDQIKSGTIPVVYSNGIQNFHNIGMAKGPGLVTGRSGTIGKIHFIEDGDYWPHNTSLWVTSFKGNFPKFIYFLYKSIGMNRFASGSGVPTLNRNYVHAFHAYIPPSAEEQQKIADCLSSIGELVIAETQKLEALKAHKKGLMQQLFPAEGETVPKLRFPEFRDAGEWDNEPLENLYSFKVTNSYSRDQLNYENGSVKNIHYGDIHTKFSTLFNIENELVPFINSSESLEKIKTECYCVEGDMIFADASEDLEDVGKSIEIIHLNNEKLLSGLHTLLARQKDKKLIIGFGGYLFKSNRIRMQIKKESQGAKVLGISAGRLSNIEVAFPSNKKEQQKIADCLSSIDELITAQTQKLGALKAHKKGLMQQLFPTADEIVG